MRVDKSSHIKYLEKENCPIAASALTSHPGILIIALRTIWRILFTSTPESSMGRGLRPNISKS